MGAGTHYWTRIVQPAQITSREWHCLTMLLGAAAECRFVLEWKVDGAVEGGRVRCVRWRSRGEHLFYGFESLTGAHVGLWGGLC